jgi:hypothetical protein
VAGGHRQYVMILACSSYLCMDIRTMMLTIGLDSAHPVPEVVEVAE